MSDLDQSIGSVLDPVTPELVVRSFTYHDRALLLPELGLAIDRAGGWVLERQPLSAEAVEMHVEVQLVSLPDLYACFLETGLELTRESHRLLAEQCNCSMHLKPRYGVSSILAMRVEVHFLPDPPEPLDLSRLILLGAAAA